MVHFEFIINGPPVSQQTRRRENLRGWIDYVRTEARRHWNRDVPLTEDITVQITYFYDTIALDVDNIIKPILDALKGVVFVDDIQISDVISRKRNLRGTYEIANASRVIVSGLTAGIEFLHILVYSSPELQDRHL